MKDNGIDNLIKVMKAVPTDIRKGEVRTVDCPVCGAKDKLLVQCSDYNGQLFISCNECGIKVMQ